MALKQIKSKIIATKRTSQVTKAMESVSAIKMRKSQERAFLGRPHVHAALRILGRLANAGFGLQHQLTTEKMSGKVLAVIVTSDKGLAGSVNSAVLKQAGELFRKYEVVDVIAVGRKAAEFSQREKKTTLASYTNVSDGVTLDDVYAITNTSIDAFKTDIYQKVVVIYQNFVSTFEQNPVVRQVLPVRTDEVSDVMKCIKPKTGRFSNNGYTEGLMAPYAVEPSAEEVLNTLLPQLVQVLFYHAILESKASEHSARMVAMKSATDKSKKMVKTLTIKYNNKRQAAITAEVSEITAGEETPE